MLCVSIKGPTFEEAFQQITKAVVVADMVELRLDLLTSGVIDLKEIAKLRSAFSIPMIFTLRTSHHSLREIVSTIALNPEYMDLDAAIPVDYVEEISGKAPNSKIILSHHDFSVTPDNLDEIYQTMAKTPAYFYKLACMAHSFLDALHLMCWAKRQNSNVIAISMGQYGSVSRIIGPIIGTPITYASLADGQETAPGQLSVDTLLQQYRFRSVFPNTALYGLIGDPVERSISSVLHNKFCSDVGINALYVKMQVTPKEVGRFMQLARQLPFSGLSVTMPLKEVVLPYLDEIDPQAQDIGAVNTLLFQDGKVIGYNTDSVGALCAIERSVDVKDKKMVIIGAGGAAKAIAYEALRRGAHVTIVGRNEEKIREAARHLCCSFERLDHMIDCTKKGYDILINCTPAPMPIAPEEILPGTIVMDIKTRPVMTPFLQAALDRHCQIVYGYQMFVEQAVCQWMIWRKDRSLLQEWRAILEKKTGEYLMQVLGCVPKV